jgi:hypothetical protein
MSLYESRIVKSVPATGCYVLSPPAVFDWGASARRFEPALDVARGTFV